MSPTDSPTDEAPGSSDLVPGASYNHDAAEYAYPAEQVRDWIARPSSAPETKLVFLTFDDGPAEKTSEMLDMLSEQGVPATFFLLGRRVAELPELLERQIREGHAIALHSYSHDYDRLYPGRSASPANIREEIHDSKAAVREVLGDDFSTTAWRYPGGRDSWNNMAAADEVLAEEGLASVDWNALTGDAEPERTRPKTQAEMVELSILPTTWDAPVVVLLAHDTRHAQLTLESMPAIIAAYRDAGYSFGVIG